MLASQPSVNIWVCFKIGMPQIPEVIALKRHCVAFWFWNENWNFPAFWFGLIRWFNFFKHSEFKIELASQPSHKHWLSSLLFHMASQPILASQPNPPVPDIPSVLASNVDAGSWRGAAHRDDVVCLVKRHICDHALSQNLLVLPECRIYKSGIHPDTKCLKTTLSTDVLLIWLGRFHCELLLVYFLIFLEHIHKKYVPLTGWGIQLTTATSSGIKCWL